MMNVLEVKSIPFPPRTKSLDFEVGIVMAGFDGLGKQKVIISITFRRYGVFFFSRWDRRLAFMRSIERLCFLRATRFFLFIQPPV
jgi:hypothetical protein